MRTNSQLLRRIAMPYFILLTVIISIAMIIVYNSLIVRMKNDASNSARQLANTAANQVSTYINELDVLAEQVNHQPKITNIFYEFNKERTGENRFEKDILSDIEISSALQSLLIFRATDYNISVYNENGDFVSSQDFMIDKKKLNNAMRSMDYGAELGKIAENGGTLVTKPQKNPWTHSETAFVTLKRPLKNDYSDEICGIVEVRASVRLLGERLSGGTDDGGVLIRDRADGDIIYPADYVYEKGSGESVASAISGTDWETVINYSIPDTSPYTSRILIVFILLYLLLMGFIFFITNIVGRYVTRPIMQLAQYVKTINAPDEQLERVDEEAIDEIKELEDSFDKMLERMNRLITQEKQAYSLALQAQMNPHFLYNSLSVIGAAGVEAGCDRVSDMCIELSDMLRYVTAYEKVTVPLKDEAAHTKNYLSLMKSRYEDYFNYSIDIDRQLMDTAVPKLFIQPLAENCFMHAFKDAEPPWRVDIKITGSPNRWELTVKDNGSGISKEKIEEIGEKIENALSEMPLGVTEGLGIVNTIVRLRLTRSEPVQYSIWNDGGMVIKIIVGDKENGYV